MNKQEQYLQNSIDNKPNLSEIYADSETYDEYMEKALEAGADQDEAHEWWYELTSKYSQ